MDADRLPYLAFIFWILLITMTLIVRPLLPIDETRYVSVAWEMWQKSDFLVPHLNGEPYSHKPPLFFWFIHLSWWLLGVNEWSARLIAPLFGLANLFLTAYLARRLWPEQPKIAPLAPLILMGSLAWTLFTTLTLFDMLLVFFTLLAMAGLLLAWRSGGLAGWLLTGLAIGLGMLSKGPVILLHILPVALLAPWWMQGRYAGNWLRWYFGLGLAVLLGSAIILSWAMPAAAAGGPDYAKAIFWGQTAGRISHSFAHERPWWWYLPHLLWMLFPWLLWGPLWRQFRCLKLDTGMRFCLAWSLPVFVSFSLISGKQIHYLLPLFPAFALLAARCLAAVSEPISYRGHGSIASVIVMSGILLACAPLLGDSLKISQVLNQRALLCGIVTSVLGVLLWSWRPGFIPKAALMLSGVSVMLLTLAHASIAFNIYDIVPLAKEIARLQEQGQKIAHYGEYYDQYQFLGRLRKPLETVEGSLAATEWLQQNPDGFIIFYARQNLAATQTAPIYSQAYRGKRAYLWKAKALVQEPGIVEAMLR